MNDTTVRCVREVSQNFLCKKILISKNIYVLLFFLRWSFFYYIFNSNILQQNIVYAFEHLDRKAAEGNFLDEFMIVSFRRFADFMGVVVMAARKAKYG